MSGTTVPTAPFSNPSENDGPLVLGATLTVTILAFLIFAVRAYVRVFMIRNVGWDDILMGAAMAISFAGQCVIIPEVYYGAGRHLGDIPQGDVPIGMKLNFITQPIYLVNICVVKLAVGAALHRIASTRFYKHVILGIMGFMAFYTIGCLLTVLLQCTDIRIQWDNTVQSTCWSADTLKALSYTNVALNILTDLLFAIIIPAPMLWNLNVNNRTRYTLMGILGLGVFACAAAVIKVGFLVEYGKEGDWLWDSRNITIWTVVENNVGIIAGSLPCLRPLLKGTFLSSSYGKNSSRTTKNGGGYPHAGGTMKRASWQMSSRARQKGSIKLDDASSERTFYAVRDDFELGERRTGAHAISHSGTFFTEVEAKSSNESLDRAMDFHVGAGIKRTTSVSMKYSKA